MRARPLCGGSLLYGFPVLSGRLPLGGQVTERRGGLPSAAGRVVMPLWRLVVGPALPLLAVPSHHLGTGFCRVRAAAQVPDSTTVIVDVDSARALGPLGRPGRPAVPL